MVEDHTSTTRLSGEPTGEPWASTWQGGDWVFTSAVEARTGTTTMLVL